MDWPEPGSPLAPFSPGGPRGPIGPGCPGSPRSPFMPTSPGGPFDPGFPWGPRLPRNPGLPRFPALPFGPERQRFSSLAQNWFCRRRSCSLMISFTWDSVWTNFVCLPSGEARCCLEMTSSVCPRPFKITKLFLTGT